MRLPFLENAFETQHKIVLVPDYYFYTELVALPEGIEPEEIRNYAEYALEDSSPFPLDQLYWGFLTNQNSPSSILIYAAYKPRLKANDIVDFDDAYHVLPAFVSHTGLDVASPLCFLCQYEDSLSALHFAPGQTFPVQVESVKFNEREGDEEDNNVVEENVFLASQKLIDPESLEQPGIFTCIDVRVEDETLVFSHAYQLDEYADVQMLPDNNVSGNDFLWNADIRDEHLRQKEVKARKYGQYAWSAMQASAVAAALVIFIQLFNFTGNMLVEQRRARFNENQAAEQLVKNQEVSLNTLKQFKNVALQPFTMLTILNNSRPINIHFDSAVGNSGSPFIIKGKADELEHVQNYTRLLDSSSDIKSATLDDHNTSTGRGVTFKIKADFKPFPKAGDPLALINRSDEK